MAKLKRQDAATASGVKDIAPELQAQREAWQRRKTAKAKAKRPKATYDLPAAMIEAVQSTAKAEDVSQSDIVAYALAEWLTRYEAGEVDLSDSKRPSRSLRYSLTLDLPGKWAR